MESWVRIGETVRTESEIAMRAARAANGLRALGVAPGDTIAIVLRNDFPSLEATVAAGLAGAYVVPVNWHNTKDETQYVLNDSGAKIVVIHADLLAQVRSAIPEHARVLAVATPTDIVKAYGLDP